MTVGASGVLATMTWQVPGDASAATEGGITHAASPSLIMTAANAYIDAQSTRTALQAARPRTASPNLASAKAKVQRGSDMASFAQFERKCLKKVSKRRNAKFVRVPCSPLQGDPSQAASLATSDTSPTRLR